MGSQRTAKPKLGRLEKIHPADYWQTGGDFLQWLEEPDNLDLLAEALGLSLVPVSLETPEDYRLFQVTDSQTVVLVTAQPGVSEAHHLGNLITWAATESLSMVVWVAAEFSPRHRQTLTWLNTLAQGEVTFLGIGVELWQIGKTAMAVNFIGLEGELEGDLELNPGDSPDLQPPQEVPTAAPLSEREQQNLAFWTALCDRLDRQGGLVKAGNPSPEATLSFAIARAGFRLHTILDHSHNSLYTELLLSGVDAHPHFYLLAQEREVIADEIGLPLIWDDAGDHSCVIASVWSGLDLDDHQRWTDYQGWFCDCLERFYEVFFERIKHLDASSYLARPPMAHPPLSDLLVLPASQRG
ncbi:MAG: DUF4268 domain-containing protein [Nodosilinea sp.]